jgi:hypothetical protein
MSSLRGMWTDQRSVRDCRVSGSGGGAVGIGCGGKSILLADMVAAFQVVYVLLPMKETSTTTTKNSTSSRMHEQLSLLLPSMAIATK